VAPKLLLDEHLSPEDIDLLNQSVALEEP